MPLETRIDQAAADRPVPKFRRERRGLGPPTTGTWDPGDVSWEQAPAAGGYVGYVCTGAGTPGAWHGFGAIV